MKKRFLIILGIVMVLGFVGCGKKAISEGSSEEITVEIEDTETATELEVISKDNKTFKTTNNKSNSKAVDNKNEAHSNTTQGYKSDAGLNTKANNSVSTGNTGYAVSDCSVDNSYTESNNAPVSNSRVYYPESYVNYINNSGGGSSNSNDSSGHTHSYDIPIYETVTVIDQDEWYQPIYRSGYAIMCKTCGESFDYYYNGIPVSQSFEEHCTCTGHSLSGFFGGLPTAIDTTSLVDTIYHPAVTHTEQQIVNYKCSCGATFY